MPDTERDNGSTPLVERLRELHKLLNSKRDLEAELVAVNKAISAEQPTLVAMFTDAGIERLELDGIGTFSKRENIGVKVVDEDRFLAWLRATGREAALKLTIHHMTRDALVREYVEDAAEAPPGIELAPFATITLRR